MEERTNIKRNKTKIVEEQIKGTKSINNIVQKLDYEKTVRKWITMYKKYGKDILDEK